MGSKGAPLLEHCTGIFWLLRDERRVLYGKHPPLVCSLELLVSVGRPLLQIQFPSRRKDIYGFLYVHASIVLTGAY